MTRLTKLIRENMATILLNHRFTESGNALCQESVALFGLVYDDKYDGETRKHMAAFQKRHKSAFNNQSYLKVNVKGMRFDVGERWIGKNKVNFKSKVSPRPVFNAWSDYGYIDCEIAARLADFAAAEQALQTDIVKATGEVMAVLGSFSTERSLTEGWPEIMPLVGHVLQEIVPGTGLPAVQIARINADFGLPPIDAEAG